MAGSALSAPRRSSRRGWILLLIALFAVPAMLGAGLSGYAYWANSVPPFRPSLPPLPAPNGYEKAATLSARLPAPSGVRLPRWPEGSSEQLQAAIQPVRSILNDVRSTYGLEWRAPAFLGTNQINPEFMSFRESARYFAAEAALARSQKNRGLAMQRSLDAMELGARTPRGGVMIHALVAAAIHAIGMASAERIGADLPPSEIPGALERVRRIRAAWPPVGELLEGERLFSRSAITEISERYRQQNPVAAVRYSWDQLQGSGENDFAYIDDAFALWLIPKHRVIENMDRYYRRLIAESKKPLRRRQTIPLPSDPYSSMVGQGITSYESVVWWRVHTSLALLETALAVHAHHREHGRFPSRLPQISRRWLPQTPLDAWGQPIRYRLQDGEAQIYSLGPDSKDDGARPIQFRLLEADSTGDIVWGTLFPRRR